ncbi:hypothetical protein [Nocardia stercoris]|uniref:hypothetical protein n=1 Tax=Nocardia stercoris TaxID=2483361 RepID=UPI001F1F513B|nr:hypothetical protein [Nocardia stercoris]
MSGTVSTTPGARRIDGTAVPFQEAIVAWTGAAREVLIETAHGYGHFVTVKELAGRVQEMSGVYTDAPVRTWVDAVLRKVARRDRAVGDPPLTALCVQENHTVTPSYRYVLELAALPVPEDLELHAAYARWQCYATYGTDVPAGIPPLTPKVAAARGRTVRTAEPVAEPVARPRLCPECFLELAANGNCGFCDPTR